ncbi:uridine phosphorylase [Halonotius aquaticus]|uniref:Uridine phosphorylase n=1 Tax=Halonotius aquaticus TaxID=2216978 RepID=A0A3A6PWQ6_9EURY|nr:nucleoside phosphorylase [Halonotius aquaticus]RJX42732.1 uridine phosphorylase [Halonotius aquaticus]
MTDSDAPFDTRNSENPNTDRQYHLDVTADDVADSVLLPGNPDRLAKITDVWESATEVASHREYRTATGQYRETPISVTSTGIGGPSTGIAVEELARVGAETLIRVGSCGTVRSDIAIGDLVITSGAMRGEGTSSEYIDETYPASADYEVVSALVAAAERLGHDYHVGVTLSTDSFYAGQARPGFEGYEAPGSDDLIETLKNANVANIEMEAATLLTLSNLYDLRAGAVCAVYANRETGEFATVGERKAAETASLAVALLAEMDAAKTAAGVDRWHPGLSIE